MQFSVKREKKTLGGQEAANSGEFLWNETVIEHSELKKDLHCYSEKENKKQTQAFCKWQSVGNILCLQSPRFISRVFYPISFPVLQSRLSLLMSMCQIKSWC